MAAIQAVDTFEVLLSDFHKLRPHRHCMDGNWSLLPHRANKGFAVQLLSDWSKPPHGASSLAVIFRERLGGIPQRKVPVTRTKS
jgi:hypothetical protein